MKQAKPPQDDARTKALQEEHARADALFFSIGSGVIATDEHGRISRVNDIALQTLGYMEKEVLGKRFLKVVHAVDISGKPIDPLERPITRAFLSGQPVIEKAYYKTKTNQALPVSLNVSPVLLNGRPIGAIEVFRDITKEHEIDRMKSEFISIASHQLRTPLSAINTYANMLAGDYQAQLNRDQMEHMTVILSAVERMNELITTLLDISQLEAGRINVTVKAIDLEQLLDGIIKEHKEVAKEKSIKLERKIPKNKTLIKTDPLLLGEIYSNLISNAIKYTAKNGKVNITLKQNKYELVFRVSDTGYGIPKDMQNRVFTKFFRADNAKKHEASGTGLGLYMAKQIADVLNGRLWFESIENKGSKFYFALPNT